MKTPSTAANPKPVRLQLSRRKGFKLESPNGLPVVIVDRRSPWGNPCVVTPETTPAQAVAVFRDYLDKRLSLQFEIKRELRGKNLACWCHIWQCPKCKRYLDRDYEIGATLKTPGCYCDGPCPSGPVTTMLRVPCHADVLLEIANA